MPIARIIIILLCVFSAWPAAAANVSEDAPAFAGDWVVRFSNLNPTRPAQRTQLTISADGRHRIDGVFGGADFARAAIKADATGPVLRFQTRARPSGMVRGKARGTRLRHEVRRVGATLEGVSKDERGEIAARWTARRPGDERDAGAYLSGRYWRLTSPGNSSVDACDPVIRLREDGIATFYGPVRWAVGRWRVETNEGIRLFLDGFPSDEDSECARRGVAPPPAVMTISFTDDGGFRVCTDESGETCQLEAVGAEPLSTCKARAVASEEARVRYEALQRIDDNLTPVDDPQFALALAAHADADADARLWRRPPPPQYPSGALGRESEATCAALFDVASSGRPINLAVSCTDDGFEARVEEWANTILFLPKRKNGVAVPKRRIVQPVSFCMLE